MRNFGLFKETLACLHDEQLLIGFCRFVRKFLTFTAALTKQLSRKTKIVRRQIRPPTCSDDNAVSSHNVLALHLISIIHIYERLDDHDSAAAAAAQRSRCLWTSNDESF